MPWKALLVGLLCLISTKCVAYKILFIPCQQLSHISSMMSIAEELVKRGHGVQMMIKNEYRTKYEKPTLKVKLIPFSTYEPADGKNFEEATASYAKSVFDKAATLQETTDLIRRFSRFDCTQLLNDTEKTVNQLSKEGGFDIAVVDGTIITMCFYLIPYRLRIPWITYTDFPIPWDIRVPWLPSITPHQFSKYTERMNFMERLKNTMLNVYMYINPPKMENTEDEITLLKFKRKYGEFGSLKDLLKRSKLFLITSNMVLDYPKPLMPNVVEIGGLTIREPKPLPDGMRVFMDEAELGVIVVSFGSMMSQYPKHFVDKFTSAFQQLKGYRVVWRFHNTENLTLSKDILAEQWLPQTDVLAHPKTKLLITHCGNNGQFEGMYYRVPMIGFPFHADQPYNGKRIEYKGYGISMNLYSFTSELLLANIHTILSDPSYRARVSHASAIFRSARETPAERAATWVEHICRFGGDHLRSAGNDLPMYQYLLIDVVFIVFLGLALVLWVVYKAFKSITRCFCHLLGSEIRLKIKRKTQ